MYFLVSHSLLYNKYMNLWLELDNWRTVAQLVGALHRNRRAAGSIPVRDFAAAPGNL